ncbi:hypothetical protein P4O66_019491, partial [Electrophorus voltai]
VIPKIMEVVLTRLRDFSCKEATFDDRDRQAAEEVCRVGSLSPHHSGRLDIESALAWLRRELFTDGCETVMVCGVSLVLSQMEMRSQDQVLIRQLMDLHAGIQELKQEYVLDNGEDEEEAAPEEEEEPCWDSGSEAGGSSSSSYSGESSLYPSVYPLFHISALHFSFQPKRAFSRRSSVP